MPDSKKKRLSNKWLAAGALLVAGLAWASPWDIDMIDSTAYKAYEWKMLPMFAEGTVVRPMGSVPRAKDNGAYQNDYIEAMDRMAPYVADLKNPYKVDEASLAQGERLFQVTCAPCHGIQGKGGGPVTYNDPAKNIRRFPMAAPMLSGEGNVSKTRSDGYIYLTIRNGGAGMPAYGISLTDMERWSIVSYIRTLEGAEAPAPVVPEAPVAPQATPDQGAQKATPNPPKLPLNPKLLKQGR